ncbi:MAG: DUF805 domain-containing protein [Paracoccaceae bacterium]
MNFNQSVRTVFSRYATFSGRARRSEYWWFYLFLLIAGIVLGFFDGLIFGSQDTDPAPISAIFSLATFVPTIAVTARRLHDVERSGWWQIAPISVIFLTILMVAIQAFILAFAAGAAAVVCVILLLVWTIRKGTHGPNEYGADPLGGNSGPDDDDDMRRTWVPPVNRND